MNKHKDLMLKKGWKDFIHPLVLPINDYPHVLSPFISYFKENNDISSLSEVMVENFDKLIEYVYKNRRDQSVSKDTIRNTYHELIHT